MGLDLKKVVPDWYAEGTEPPSTLKQSGFQAGYKPPANYFNWFWSGVSAALLEMQQELSKAVFGTPIVAAQSTDGVAYTATLEDTEIYDGMELIIVPNMTSTSKATTFNLNDTGAKYLRMNLTYNLGNSGTTAPIDTWLGANVPVKIMYKEKYGYWFTEIGRPSANSIYGKVPIQSGGWYDNTTTTDEDKAEALEALELLGLYGKNSTVPIANGGTGATNAADARTNLGIPTYSDATASAAGLMSAADKTKLDSLSTGGGYKIPFATCSTAYDTAAKVATITNSISFSLTEGSVVAVKFSKGMLGNKISTLNVDSTGAKTVKMESGGDCIEPSASTVTFLYDGTYWVSTNFQPEYQINYGT